MTREPGWCMSPTAFQIAASTIPARRKGARGFIIPRRRKPLAGGVLHPARRRAGGAAGAAVRAVVCPDCGGDGGFECVACDGHGEIEPAPAAVDYEEDYSDGR